MNTESPSQPWIVDRSLAASGAGYPAAEREGTWHFGALEAESDAADPRGLVAAARDWIENRFFRSTAGRCGFVNASTAAVQLVVFTVCAAFMAAPLLVATRWSLGILTAVARFFLNRYWVFDARGERKRGQALRFGLMSLASVTLGTLVFGTLLALVGQWIHPLLVQIASMATVWLAFGYPATRKFVFRR